MIFRVVFPLSLMLVLGSCADRVSQAYILDRARAEIAAREGWAHLAYVRIDRAPGVEPRRLRDRVWKLSACALDQSSYPEYDGINPIPGSQRTLVFTRDGCLIDYRGSRPCGGAPPARDTASAAGEPQGK